MEVGKAVTYVDASGKIQDALLASLVDGLANVVVVNADGASDSFGKNRAELRGISVRDSAPCVCELDAYSPPKKKKNKKAV